MDQGFGHENAWEDLAYAGDEKEQDYEQLDISSLRHFKGERAGLRKLKLGSFEGYVDMHLYEEPTNGNGDMW